MKKITIIIIVILLLLIGYKYTTRENITKNPINTDIQNSQTIQAYIRANISSLSPIKEQLGGKFFVTTIVVNGDTGVVEYEDGHNAYTADFFYTIDEKGAPFVSSFDVRK